METPLEPAAPQAGGLRRALALLVLLLVPALAVIHWTTRDAWVSPDGYAYVVGGYHLARGDGYVIDIPTKTPPTSITAWPPLYSALIAAATRGGAHPLGAAMWIVGLSWLLLVAGTWALGRALGAPRAGFAAALFVATSAEVFAWAHMALSDLPFAALAVGALALLVWYQRHARRDLLVAGGVGLLVALAVLLRHIGVVLLAPALLVIWRVAPAARRARLGALAVGLPLVALVGWMIRNARLTDAGGGGAVQRVADLPWDKTVEGATIEPLRSVAQALVPGVRLAFPAIVDYPHSTLAMVVALVALVALVAGLGVGAVRAWRRGETHRQWTLVGVTAAVYLGALVLLKLTGLFTDPISGRFLLWLTPLLVLAAFAFFPVATRPQRIAFWATVALLVVPNCVMLPSVGAWYARNRQGQFNYRGSLLYSLGFDSQARQDFRGCLRHLDALHRDVPNLKLSRFTAGWCHQSLGDLPSAVREYEAATVHDPRLAQAHLNLGWAHLALKEPRRAVAAFDRVLGLEPGNGNARAGRAAALQALARQP